MLKRFKQYKKWRQLIDITSTEVQISIVVSIIVTILAILLQAFENIEIFISSIKDMLSIFISGFIALTGFVLAGVAIITSLFSKDQLKIIEKDNPDSITVTLVSFEYLAFISAISIIPLALVFIAMDIPAQIINNICFYTLSFFITYDIVFILIYTVALCGNCIRLYNISITAERIATLENEVKELQDKIKVDKNNKQ